MSLWSLRTRLTIWSAGLSAAAVTLLGALTLSLVRTHQIESLDAMLADESRAVFHEIAEHGVAGIGHGTMVLDKNTRTEVTTAGGEVLWASPDLAAAVKQAPEGAHTLGDWRALTQTMGAYTVRVARDFRDVEATLSDVRSAFLRSVPFLIALVAGGAWWLARSALRPVQEISRTARRISSEHLDARLPQPTRLDEIGQLSAVLNDMLDRLERGHQQAVRFSADASHELRTPLALIAAGLEELLRRDDLPRDVSAALGSLLDDTHRLASICQDLLVLARADAGQLTLHRERTDLTALLEAAVEDARVLAGEGDLSFAVTAPPMAIAAVDQRYVTRILLNLLSNAVKYNRAGGEVRVRLTAEGDGWCLDVGSTGTPIAPEDQERVFDRFFRPARHASVPGQGLGLSLSRELARAHGGDLTLRCSDATLTEFHLTLPRESEASPCPASPPID